MKKLATLTHLVKEVLELRPETRANDGELVLCVFERIGIEPWNSLEYIVEAGYFSFISSIIRTRRKIQQEREDLCDKEAEARRHTYEATFRAYARSYLSEILTYEGEDK